MSGFDPKIFVENQLKEIKRALGDNRALIAVSGGVDSTTCAVLTHRAIGENLLCVIIDTALPVGEVARQVLERIEVKD